MITSKPIFVPLSHEPYAAFESGVKTVEVRNKDSPVARQVFKDPLPGRPVTLSLAYKWPRIHGTLGRVVYVRDWWALPSWAVDGAHIRGDPELSRFFRAHEPLIAFEVKR